VTTDDDDDDGGRSRVHFENTRFDPDLTPFHDIARQMADAFGYTAELSLDRRLAQLLRLRVAQLNPCPYCLVLHSRSALEKGIPADVVAHLPGWRESAMFSPVEKAALAYCEGLTRYDIADFARLHDDLRVHFDEREVAELAAVVINMNVWTRLKLAQGQTPVADATPSADASGPDESAAHA
jgi:AhpD family alkylhydroperoxidase